MSRAALNSRLSDPGFAPKDVGSAAAEARAWFMTTAAHEAFVVMAVFRDMTARDLDDQQAVPTADWSRFTADVLPGLRAVVAGDPGVALADLVLGYHSSI